MKKQAFIALGLSLALVCPTFAYGKAVPYPPAIETSVEGEENLAPNYLTHGLKAISYGYERPDYYDHMSFFAMARAGLYPGEFLIDDFKETAKNKVKKDLQDMSIVEKAKIILGFSSVGIKNTDFWPKANIVDSIAGPTAIVRRGLSSDNLMYGLLALDSDTSNSKGWGWRRGRAIEELLKFQNPDGSFSLERGKIDDKMVKTTALAVQALAPYYTNPKAASHKRVVTSVDKAVEYLKSQIDENGGYENNPTSTSAVVVALTSIGKDPTKEEGFSKGKKNPVNYLYQFKKERGYSLFPSGKEDAAATIDITNALDSYIRLLNGNTSLYNCSDVDEHFFDESKEILELKFNYINRLANYTGEVNYKGNELNKISDVFNQAIKDIRDANTKEEVHQVFNKAKEDIDNIIEKEKAEKHLYTERTIVNDQYNINLKGRFKKEAQLTVEPLSKDEDIINTDPKAQEGKDFIKAYKLSVPEDTYQFPLTVSLKLEDRYKDRELYIYGASEYHYIPLDYENNNGRVEFSIATLSPIVILAKPLSENANNETLPNDNSNKDTTTNGDNTTKPSDKEKDNVVEDTPNGNSNKDNTTNGDNNTKPSNKEKDNVVEDNPNDNSNKDTTTNDDNNTKPADKGKNNVVEGNTNDNSNKDNTTNGDNNTKPSETEKHKGIGDNRASSNKNNCNSLVKDINKKEQENLEDNKVSTSLIAETKDKNNQNKIDDSTKKTKPVKTGDTSSIFLLTSLISISVFLISLLKKKFSKNK